MAPGNARPCNDWKGAERLAADHFMSQAEDDELRDLLYDEPGQRDEIISSESYWTTRERQRVRVYDMADSHLLNTIRVLRGKSPLKTRWSGDPVRRREWLNVMANEAYRRGLRIEEPDEKDPLHE